MGNPADSWHTHFHTHTLQNTTERTLPPSSSSLLSPQVIVGKGTASTYRTVLYRPKIQIPPLWHQVNSLSAFFPLRRIRSNWHPRCSVHSTIPTSTHCYPAASPLCLHSGPVATPIYGPLVRNVAPRTVENPATTTAAAASSVLERERHDTCT